MTVTGWNWLALALLALFASLAGGGGQLAFVVALGLGLGLLHGASDLKLVLPARRFRFVGCYLAVALISLACWQVASTLALALFLLMSIWHFAHEDDLFPHRVTSLAVAMFIVGGPALLHGEAVAQLLAAAMGPQVPAETGVVVSTLLAAGGAVALPILLWAAWQRRCLWMMATLAGITVAPPLIGFALGFYCLHAAPQTHARQRLLGVPSLTAYMWLTWPVLLASALFILAGGIVFLPQEHTGMRALFALLAAFAVPHMLVLPRFLHPGSGYSASTSQAIEP
ncbi:MULTISPECIES: Brp/Blh family beta-carotene 15,15'-dioxygenase [Pseudomonas]|uniref:Probable beta-carotene 15,15'-dioxygenase n=1 Tax=Pseudomonas quercus TaxID=2722792 RepID=A0ABX0YHK7_9PSED|nr:MULTISPECIES: Brp/Blh family beta-carotene 15,15'-dioxygenase [Pseudomonas]MBF7142930.1 Brp/Blh family beta-carotene 15,15'-dioxygenase [Pseudomonas sp. LY10J]NJP01478.1 hypothetical protein [Pseudomonas quercus]